MTEKKKRAYSEAQNRASQKWSNANYYRFSVHFPIEEKEILKAAAEKKGLSVAAYIHEAVYEKMERDSE